MNADKLHTDFSVTEAFIIKVYTHQSAALCKVSFSLTCFVLTKRQNAATSTSSENSEADSLLAQTLEDDTDKLCAIYLVEPKRVTTVVQKFSGTLGTTSRRDQQAITMAAFAHFVIEFTRCYYMIADIQGKFLFAMNKSDF